MAKIIAKEVWDKIGVLVTSHPRQQKFWNQAFASWVGYPHYMLLGYDDDTLKNVPFSKFMPPVKEMFITGFPSGKLGHFRGELCQLKMAADILEEKGKEFFYKTAADNTCYRWRMLPYLHKTLKRNDLLICGTTQMFGKVSALKKAMEIWHPKLRAGGAELYLYSQIRAHKLNVTYQKAPYWHETLGLIHIQGEVALNQQTAVMRTWIDGQIWGEENPHRDLTQKRLDYFKDHKLIYPDEALIREK